MFVFTRRAILAAPLLAALPAFAEDAETDTLVLTTKHGKTVIKLRPDIAPKTVAQIKKLVKRKFYDGLKFHRVIPNFMAQTGDPRGDGTGGSDLPNVPGEFGGHFSRGAVGMARSNSPDSGNSQFFICTGEPSFLDGKYTVFGKVVSGMEFIDAIAQGEPPATPDKILTLRFGADEQ